MLRLVSPGVHQPPREEPAALVTSPSDAYTLLFVAPNNAISTSPHKKLPYDFIRDTVPVAGIMRLTNMMVVPRSGSPLMARSGPSGPVV